MKNLPVASTGTFLERINQNIINGWEYPKNVIVTGSSPRGRWGNATDYYFCDGSSMFYLCSIPHGAGRNGKYKMEYDKVEEYEKLVEDKKPYYLQSFIKERK